jgi:hypothetical protein
MLKRLLALLFVIVGASAFTPATIQQDLPELISLSAEAGFDGSFREDQWMPVFVRVENNGPDIEGAISVRPETSTNAVNNSYSLPISLPTGSRKAVFLYITARGFATQIRVDLIDSQGVTITGENASLRALQPRDQLHVIFTQSPAGAIDLGRVHDGGYSAFQANWQIENLPDRAAALSSVNTLVFSEIDTGTLSSAQQQAITDWVAQGGHLIVTGGPNWQRTASGLIDLLPLNPSDSTAQPNLTPIAHWMRLAPEALQRETLIATGTIKPDAQILAGTPETPLIVRRAFGAGTVDYLAADPNAAPLRGWGGLSDLWLVLATTVHPRPSWTYGVAEWQDAASAVNILPGVNLLPDILPLCGFLAVYIALIGPVNYIVLNRLNRREWAWVSIPFFILLFSAIAWISGFNLRGNEVTLSRLTVVQTWPETNRAAVREFVGLLSPRRAQYSLALEGSTMLRPIPRIAQTTALFAGGLQTSTRIEQTDQFRAARFSVDASYIAAFDGDTVLSRPAIDGSATLVTENLTGMQTVRGSVTNNTDRPLTNPVILVRGQVLRLENDLAPGDIATFDLTLPGEGLPSPSPLAFTEGGFRSVYLRSSRYYTGSGLPQTVRDIMGDQIPSQGYFTFRSLNGTPSEQEAYRRTLLLTSMVQDPYGILTGRGNHAYFAAWSDAAPLDIEVEGGNWRSIDTTLYLVQLAVEITRPTGRTRITPDQFTWYVPSRTSMTDIAPLDLAFAPGDEVIFRFTPLPDSVLRRVDELSVFVDRSLSTNRSLPFQLWNWETQSWEDWRIQTGNQLTISNPQPFLGPHNAVQIRLTADSMGGYPRIDDLTIEQAGIF